ncbi:MAG: IclR family transcriptional regulator [Comamonadaceae bacterium]|nr:MAG: IclR family transcriptional regulator [Comamonadaceae bacterium]
MASSDQEKSGDGVRAVARALDILLAFSAGEAELTVSDILKRVDLSRPTLYRLLYTLEENGFVTSSGDPQRFRLGPSVARLSWAWSASLDLAQIAQPVMRNVWTETGETVALFVPQGSMRVCIAEMQSTQPLSFKRGVGYTERIVRGASGRAILAWTDTPPESLAELCEGLDTRPAQLQAELRAIRKRGYALSHNELIKGAIAVAVPFFDRGEKVAGSIGVFGPDVRLDTARIDAMAVRLVEHARQLSVLLGREQPRTS